MHEVCQHPALGRAGKGCLPDLLCAVLCIATLYCHIVLLRSPCSGLCLLRVRSHIGPLGLGLLQGRKGAPTLNAGDHIEYEDTTSARKDKTSTRKEEQNQSPVQRVDADCTHQRLRPLLPVAWQSRPSPAGSPWSSTDGTAGL